MLFPVVVFIKSCSTRRRFRAGFASSWNNFRILKTMCYNNNNNNKRACDDDAQRSKLFLEKEEVRLLVFFDE